MSSKKLSFSLEANKKGKRQGAIGTPAAAVTAAAFNDPDADSQSEERFNNINPDIPKKPLVIPLQHDSRKSLQEQARSRRKNDQIIDNSNSNNSSVSEEDQAAIQSLQREAAAAQETNENGNENGNNKRIIASSGDTFQQRDDDENQFREEIEKLPPDLSVKSQIYKTVPIGEFGAAMLRGMGWTGGSNGNARSKATVR